MRIKYFIIIVYLLLASVSLAKAQTSNELGQTIQIYTRLHSFVGKPSWLLMIRDLDNGINIPYLYDISRGENFWLALTYGHHYLITASTMQFSPYEKLKINNFCHLESRGHILRGESLYITISGDLTPNTNTYTCNVSRYTDTNFSVAN